MKNLKKTSITKPSKMRAMRFLIFFWIDNEILRRMAISKLKMDIWWKIVIFQHILGLKTFYSCVIWCPGWSLDEDLDIPEKCKKMSKFSKHKNCENINKFHKNIRNFEICWCLKFQNLKFWHLKFQNLKFQKFEIWNFKIWNFKIWNFKIWNFKIRNFKVLNFVNLKFENLNFQNSNFEISNFKIWNFKIQY